MKKALFGLAFLAIALTAGAQQLPKLPIDSAVRVGHLDNGLTYYIRHQEQPKQRCDFHIAQAVGAILEEDNQNGLAHFLEHMAFNGTQHFPGKGIINYFESIGVNFGGNINAYTSLDETVYRLSDVPTIREGIIDSALLVMHDWACALSLVPEEIDAERGVIREEWRTRTTTASRRMWSKGQTLMYPGSQYAKRDIIGDTAIINNFAYDALRAYYKKWYGPDNQAIIVVGDIDPDVIEAKIKALWSDVPARTNRGERPIYTVADNDEPIIAIVKDKEAQSTAIRIYYKHDVLPEAAQGTIQDETMRCIYSLIENVISERFTALAMDPNSPILGGAMGYQFNLVKQKSAFLGYAQAKEGRETEAYQLLLTEMERLRRYGVTEAELERAKQELINAYEKMYNERTTRGNQSLAREYIRHFLDNEPIPGIEMEYQLMKQMLPHLTSAQINPIFDKLMPEHNQIVCFMGPDKAGVNIPTEATALSMLKDIRKTEIAAPAEEKIDATLIKKAPRAGRIVKKAKNEAIGSTEWTLSNGVKVAILPTEWKKDEINLSAFSEGGLATIKNVDDLPSAQLATTLVDYMGLGDWSMTDLQKKLSGKNVSTHFAINNYSESVSGTSTTKDFETMLQLIYLQFTALRKDEQVYKTLMTSLEQQLLNKEQNHKAIWRDSISLMRTNHSPRTIIMDQEMLAKVNLDKCLKIHRERFKNASDFTFMFVGNINPDDPQTQRLICQWLGSLPAKGKKDARPDDGVRMAPGMQQNYFSREMKIHTASNYIIYSSYDMPYSLDLAVNMRMIGRVLSTRYLESIREKEGGSYGVGCSGIAAQHPVDYAMLIMQFDTDPDKQQKLMSIIHKEVMEIVNNGPLENDVTKEKASMLKDLEEDRETNAWWMGAVMINYYRYGINYLADYKKAVENITPESVQKTLKKLTEANNVMEIVMMPER